MALSEMPNPGFQILNPSLQSLFFLEKIIKAG